MKIQRAIKERMVEEINEGKKVLVLYGARQTGKTTLSNELLESLQGKILKVNADESRYIDVLSSRNLDTMKLLIDDADVLFIDEAQQIPEIGINLKIIKDSLPDLKILVTGSFSFELADKIKEPLTGRISTHSLFPVSLLELRQHYSVFDLQNHLEEYMIYGMYPELFSYTSTSKKEKYLRDLASSYLFKDIFKISGIRNKKVISDLLRLLAFQAGSEVSLNELASALKISQETVSNYIELLEQAFIVFRLGGYSRNLRKEISKRDKIYFWDNGVRNMLINNFSLPDMRMDTGILWENFMVAERLKYLSYTGNYSESYFWRIYTGAEIDYVEEYNGELFAWEIKYKKVRKKPPATWVENYGNNFTCITRENFWEFVIEQK
jgi:uncharacterized protein